MVFAALVGLLLPPLAKQGTDLANNAPAYVESLLRNKQVKSLDEHYHVISKLQEQLKAKLSDGQVWTDVFGGVLGAGKAAVSGVFSAVHGAGADPLPDRVAADGQGGLLPRRAGQPARPRAAPWATRSPAGSAVTSSARSPSRRPTRSAPTSCCGSWACPIPRRSPCWSAVLGLIPMVGATLGAVVVVLVALFSSVTTAVVAAVYYVIYQQVENYVIAPRVMKRTIAVPGAVTVIAALAGGTLLGVIGALMAIPTAAGLILIYQEVVVPRQAQH